MVQIWSDRKSFISKAVENIAKRIGPVVKSSNLYESEPIGAADQAFINGAILVESDLAPTTVMKTLLEIEIELGRERSVKWGNRTIDLDIILIEKDSSSLQFNSELLMVPHPEAQNREFVMVPISEVVPNWRFYPSHASCKEYSHNNFSKHQMKKA